MSCLILDTSTDLCLLALAEQNQIAMQEIFSHQNALSKNLFPSIQSLLQKKGLIPSDLKEIAVGIGPGSYTGTRLGAAVAKSLAFGLKIPIKSFHSPLAFLPDHSGSFALIIPTKPGSFFLLKGHKEKMNVCQEMTDILSAEAVIEEVQNINYIVCPAPLSLPAPLQKLPCFKPFANLAVLCQFLATVEASTPEQIQMQYLHTPSF